MSEENLKRLKTFHKIAFGATALLLTSCGIYNYLTENNPDILRKLIFDKYFETYHKKIVENNSTVNVC